jgi:quercetin dioxygenase-like cupin family protein
MYVIAGVSGCQHPDRARRSSDTGHVEKSSRVPELNPIGQLFLGHHTSGFPGKEGLMITVVYPPGGSDPIHRHNAHAFVYVLEGSIVMQVKGGKEITLTPGQSFYEGPNDIHTVGRNASTTKPAKFIVVPLKDKQAPVVLPVNPASATVVNSRVN